MRDASFLDTLSIDQASFSVRVVNGLRLDPDLDTLGKLHRLSDAGLLRIPGFGRKSLAEMRAEISRILGDDNFEPHAYTAHAQKAALPPEVFEWVQAHPNLIRALMNGEVVMASEQKR